ncbi:MAG: Ran-binding zinc finger domain-containing protein [Bacteroidota bacterium]
MSDILVGRWDCKSCGNIGVLGPLTRCPNCGSARPEDVQFYLPDDAEEVTDAEEIKKAKSGADWVCSHCSTHNKAWDTQCMGCGSPRDEASDDDRQLQQRDILYNQPKTSSTPSRPRRNPRKLLYGLGGFFAVILVIAFVFGYESEYEVTVVEHRWEREIAVKNYRQVEDEDWQLPREATLVEKFQAVHHTDRVLRGYETRTRTKRIKVGEERYVAGTRDLGNGNFEKIYKTRPIYENREETYEAPVYENVPVYKTKYRYLIYRWKPDTPIRASGKGKVAVWPELPRKSDPKNWKLGNRTATYTLIAKEDDGKTHNEEVSEQFWQRTQNGSTVKAVKGAVMGDFRGVIQTE